MTEHLTNQYGMYFFMLNKNEKFTSRYSNGYDDKDDENSFVMFTLFYIFILYPHPAPLQTAKVFLTGALYRSYMNFFLF